MDNSLRMKKVRSAKKAASHVALTFLNEKAPFSCFYESDTGTDINFESSGYTKWFNALLLNMWPCTDPVDEAEGSPQAILKARFKFFQFVKNEASTEEKATFNAGMLAEE